MTITDDFSPVYRTLSKKSWTNELIQKTTRDKFRECGVLTIAHRLNTVRDRILVLHAGKIHAYDEPYTLLQDPDGIFYKMEAAALLEAAKRVYKPS